MVMEFMPGGPILSSSRAPGLTTEPLPEPAARSYFRYEAPTRHCSYCPCVVHGRGFRTTAVADAVAASTLTLCNSADATGWSGCLHTPCRELVSAVDYLHSNLIVHGDLKPDNLLLSADGRLKISDFGSATVLVSGQHATAALQQGPTCGSTFPRIECSA